MSAIENIPERMARVETAMDTLITRLEEIHQTFVR
jgi:hypothetical protein